MGYHIIWLTINCSYPTCWELMWETHSILERSCKARRHSRRSPWATSSPAMYTDQRSLRLSPRRCLQTSPVGRSLPSLQVGQRDNTKKYLSLQYNEQITFQVTSRQMFLIQMHAIEGILILIEEEEEKWLIIIPTLRLALSSRLETVKSSSFTRSPKAGERFYMTTFYDITITNGLHFCKNKHQTHLRFQHCFHMKPAIRHQVK